LQSSIRSPSGPARIQPLVHPLTMILRIRPVLFFLLILLVPAASMAQQKVKNKGPMYEDESVIIYKNLLQIRLPVLFYGYTFAQNTYEKKHTPVLLGARYEHLLNSIMAIGGEIEYNYWNPLPASVDAGSSTAHKSPYNRLPEKESLFRFTPGMRFYLRSHKNRKAFFRGFFVTPGVTVYSITQVVDGYRTQIAQRPYPDKIQAPIVYKNSSGFGVSMSVGYSLVFRSGITASASLEGFACGDPFKQEGYLSKSVGNGTILLNPFRFYVGYRF